MTRPLFALLLLAWALAAGAARAAAVAPSASSVAAPPRRVVSLDLCTDEMIVYYSARAPALRAEVAALSPLSLAARQDSGGPGRAGDGVDFSGWPAHDGSIERVLALHPDLVLTGAYNALLLRQRLAQLGVRVAVLPLPQRLDDIAPYERRLLTLLGLPASLAAAADAEEADAPLAPVTGVPGDDAQRAPRLLLLGPNGIGTGVATLEGDILARAGWRNYVQARGYVALDLERIVTDPPDAVLWAAPTSPALANRLAEHPALRRAVPASHWLSTRSWRWECPGPWSWALVRELARARARIEHDRTDARQ